MKFSIQYRFGRFAIHGILFMVLFAGFAGPIFAQTTNQTPPVNQSESTPAITPRESNTTPATTPQTGVNLTLSPTFLSLVTDPGKKVASQIKITNNNTFTENLKIEIAKFTLTGGGTRPLISEMGAGDTYAEWVEFDKTAFSVGSGQTQTVNFSITPDDTASLGYYYAFIINRQQEQEQQDQGAVISGSPAVLTLLEVRSPNAKRELSITDFKTDRLFYEYLPVEFQITVKNTGNIHIAPVGDIFVDSVRNRNIASLKANEGRANVLPNSERVFTAVWNDGFAVKVPKEENGQIKPDENGNISYTVKYDFSEANKFRIGKYTATVVMAYNNGEKDVPIEATVSFWVIPWKILGVAFIILILAVIGLKNTILPPIKRIFKR